MLGGETTLRTFWPSSWHQWLGSMSHWKINNSVPWNSGRKRRWLPWRSRDATSPWCHGRHTCSREGRTGRHAAPFSAQDLWYFYPELALHPMLGIKKSPISVIQSTVVCTLHCFLLSVHCCVLCLLLGYVTNCNDECGWHFKMPLHHICCA